MVDSFGNILNTPLSSLLVTLGTIFLIIAVIGNSRIWVIELNPGGFGRFLGLILGIVFYVVAFSSLLLPVDFWQMISEALTNQLQENIKSFVPYLSQ
jgi:hypothetical protein